MKYKIISLNNTPSNSSIITKYINWLVCIRTKSNTPILSQEEIQHNALIYLKTLLNSYTVNPLLLIDPHTSFVFSKGKKQLELYFTGELPIKYNFVSSSARNNYFQKELQKILDAIYTFGISETKELSPLTRRRNHTLKGKPSIGKVEPNRWSRTRETWGSKSTLHKISLKIALTDPGIRLVEEALKDPREIRMQQTRTPVKPDIY